MPSPSLASVLFAVGLAACATPAQLSQTGQAAAPTPPQAERTLVAAVRVEPLRIAAKSTASTFVNLHTSVAVFNATLDLVDGSGAAQAYLAEALPQLNTDSWQVFPDGRMETRHHLKPNLVWHDGTPLSAADFVFSCKVFAKPDLGTAGSPPISAMEAGAAPDDRTLVPRADSPGPCWRQA